jgi:hypothetical protein
MKIPVIGENVMIWFKPHVGILMRPGVVKTVGQKHITVEHGGHDNTYALKNIKSITWNP